MMSSSNPDSLFAGVWRLDSLIGVRNGLSYYTATHTATGMETLVQTIDAASDRASALLQSWRIAAGIDEPQILKVHETGEALIEGTRHLYCALELPEDDLSDKLAPAKLDSEQAWEIAGTVSRALQPLHDRGLKHGAVEPANLLVVGGLVKLSVDNIAPGDPADLRHSSRSERGRAHPRPG